MKPPTLSKGGVPVDKHGPKSPLVLVTSLSSVGKVPELYLAAQIRMQTNLAHLQWAGTQDSPHECSHHAMTGPLQKWMNQGAPTLYSHVSKALVYRPCQVRIEDQDKSTLRVQVPSLAGQGEYNRAYGAVFILGCESCVYGINTMWAKAGEATASPATLAEAMAKAAAESMAKAEAAAITEPVIVIQTEPSSDHWADFLSPKPKPSGVTLLGLKVGDKVKYIAGVKVDSGSLDSAKLVEGLIGEITEFVHSKHSDDKWSVKVKWPDGKIVFYGYPQNLVKVEDAPTKKACTGHFPVYFSWCSQCKDANLAKIKANVAAAVIGGKKITFTPLDPLTPNKPNVPDVPKVKVVEGAFKLQDAVVLTPLHTGNGPMIGAKGKIIALFHVGPMADTATVQFEEDFVAAWHAYPEGKDHYPCWQVPLVHLSSKVTP